MSSSIVSEADGLVEVCVMIGSSPSMGSRNITVMTVDDTAMGMSISEVIYNYSLPSLNCN